MSPPLSAAPVERWVVRVQRTHDSIGWGGLPHDPAVCINPPPFGKQCTLLRSEAVSVCLRMQGCVALTCPDPKESWIGRKQGVTGPICQARGKQIADERGHGMCKGPQGGCINLLFRKHEGHGNHAASWAAAIEEAVPRPLLPTTAIVQLRYAGAPLPSPLLAGLLPTSRAWKLTLRNPPRGAANDDSYAIDLSGGGALKRGTRGSGARPLELRQRRRLAATNGSWA